MKGKNFRKRSIVVDDDEENSANKRNNVPEDDEEQVRRLALEEVKFLQKLRGKKLGIPALLTPTARVATGGDSINGGGTEGGLVRNDKAEADGENEDLVLQDTFAQETAVMVEDPNMLRYVEQELAKKRGKSIDDSAAQVANDIMRAEDELYQIPEHLKVKRRNSEESSTQWTTGIAEIPLPIEYKLRNIEETEAAKKLLQEKRLVARTKTESSSIPSSYSADYFQRGKDHAEKMYKDKSKDSRGVEAKPLDSNADVAVRRQAATDELMLERFRRRDRHRVMRR